MRTVRTVPATQGSPVFPLIVSFIAGCVAIVANGDRRYVLTGFLAAIALTALVVATRRIWFAALNWLPPFPRR